MQKPLELSEVMSLEERLSYVPPFPDPYVHKLIQPIFNKPAVGLLNDLILCWSEHGAPAPDQVRHTSFAKSINDVNCPCCLSLWAQGIYGGKQ